jgi:hypothetical protein
MHDAPRVLILLPSLLAPETVDKKLLQLFPDLEPIRLSTAVFCYSDIMDASVISDRGSTFETSNVRPNQWLIQRENGVARRLWRSRCAKLKVSEPKMTLMQNSSVSDDSGVLLFQFGNERVETNHRLPNRTK